VGWIAADGDNAAITIDGRAVVLKPKVRQFASEAWATRRGLILPFAPEAEAALAYDCDRNHCTPHEGVTPALGAWWSKRPPQPEALAALCQASDIVVLRAKADAPAACSRSLVLGPDAFARGGAGEIFDVPTGGWVIRWSQHVRGERPWTVPAMLMKPGGRPSTAEMSSKVWARTSSSRDAWKAELSPTRSSSGDPVSTASGGAGAASTGAATASPSHSLSVRRGQ
jgi:hypothetical protein